MKSSPPTCDKLGGRDDAKPTQARPCGVNTHVDAADWFNGTGGLAGYAELESGEAPHSWFEKVYCPCPSQAEAAIVPSTLHSSIACSEGPRSLNFIMGCLVASPGFELHYRFPVRDQASVRWHFLFNLVFYSFLNHGTFLG